MNTHGLERTNPKGEKFIGRCRYCGIENLPMSAALDPCLLAPSQNQQVLDAVRASPLAPARPESKEKR